jgi:hypothetical protein
LSREREKFSSAEFSLSRFITGLLKIRKCKFRTSADLPQFRIETLLIFHNPGANRARHAAKRHHPGEAGVGASFACAPGAEREGFSLLGFLRDCEKFRSAEFYTA